MPGTQASPGQSVRAWKAIDWRGTEAESGYYLRNTRELTDEKKIRSSDTEKNRPHCRGDTIELCLMQLAGYHLKSKMKLITVLLMENSRTTSGHKESLAVGTIKEYRTHGFQRDFPWSILGE